MPRVGDATPRARAGALDPSRVTARWRRVTARATRARTGGDEDDECAWSTGRRERPRATTTRRRDVALGMLAMTTTMDALDARARSTEDADPFARNEGTSRVLDRARARATAREDDAGEDAVARVVEDVEAKREATRAVVDEKPVVVEQRAEKRSMPTEQQDTKQLLNNQRIKTYNNAPEDFPAFIREGYDVKVIHGNDYVDQENGLIVKDYVIGDGAKPEDGQECTFQYVAYNENGGTIDSTYRRGAPASTRLGINGMIPGFEIGLKEMRVGGKRRIVVPPELGPPTGPATFFSAKQWEIFDIELVDVKSCTRSGFGMVSNVVCE